MISSDLVENLIRRLQADPVGTSYSDEGDFEQRFVTPIFCDVLGSALEPYMHPWSKKGKPRDKRKEERWHDSKAWGAIQGWGTEQAFDLLARDESENAKSIEGKEPSIAVEVKLATGKKFPTGEFQRMLGQCLLAGLVHEVVIGVFAYTGDFNYRRRDKNTRRYEGTLKREHGIHLVYKKVRKVKKKRPQHES